MTNYIIPPHLSSDRFQKGLHYIPGVYTDMVELSFMERFNLLESISPDIGHYWNPRLSATKTDIECLLDNNRIPTHREPGVVLEPYNLPSIGLLSAVISTKNTIAEPMSIRGINSEAAILEIDFNKAREI